MLFMATIRYSLTPNNYNSSAQFIYWNCATEANTLLGYTTALNAIDEKTKVMLSIVIYSIVIYSIVNVLIE